MGCIFASPESSIIRNRRKSPRYRCSRPRRVPLVAAPGRSSLEAWIRDFSLNSIGLVARQAIEPGTTLILELRSAPAGVSVTLKAKVRHATAQPDGTWFLGCVLARKLSEEEALAML